MMEYLQPKPSHKIYFGTTWCSQTSSYFKMVLSDSYLSLKPNKIVFDFKTSPRTSPKGQKSFQLAFPTLSQESFYKFDVYDSRILNCLISLNSNTLFVVACLIDAIKIRMFTHKSSAYNHYDCLHFLDPHT